MVLGVEAGEIEIRNRRDLIAKRPRSDLVCRYYAQDEGLLRRPRSKTQRDVRVGHVDLGVHEDTKDV